MIFLHFISHRRMEMRKRRSHYITFNVTAGRFQIVFQNYQIIIYLVNQPQSIYFCCTKKTLMARGGCFLFFWDILFHHINYIVYAILLCAHPNDHK